MLTLTFLPDALALILTSEPSWMWIVPLINLVVLLGGLFYTIMAMRLSLQMFAEKVNKAVEDIGELGKRMVVLEKVNHINEKLDAISERIDHIGDRLTIIETQHATNHPECAARR